MCCVLNNNDVRERKRPQKHNNKSLLLKKKQKREASREKMHQIFESFFFSFKIPPLQRKAHNAEEENFVVREISLQTNKQQHEKRGQRKERREQNARKSWPPLSPPLRFYRCSPFRRRLRLVGERGGEGAKEAPIIIR